MNDEIKSLKPDVAEMKRLIEDAAKLLGLTPFKYEMNGWLICYQDGKAVSFNPCDPERGDLWKVMEAAELVIDFESNHLLYKGERNWHSLDFAKGDHQSQVYAVLRAASAVLRARGGDKSCTAEWVKRKVEAADDGHAAAARPCDGPNGCNANNCLGCGEKARGCD